MGLREERDHPDSGLRSGDNWVVEADGKTVVEAQDDAKFSVVGRQGALLKLPAHPGSRTAGVWSTLAAWFSTPPHHRAPYA